MSTRPFGSAIRAGRWNVVSVKIEQAVELGSAAGENESRWDLLVEAGALQIIAYQSEQFVGPWLDDVGHHARKNHARRPVADAGDFDGAVFGEQRGGGAAVMALDPFRFGNRGAQADGEIVAEVVAADGDDTGVANNSAAVDDEFGGAAADVEQADA